METKQNFYVATRDPQDNFLICAGPFESRDAAAKHVPVYHRIILDMDENATDIRFGTVALPNDYNEPGLFNPLLLDPTDKLVLEQLVRPRQ